MDSAKHVLEMMRERNLTQAQLAEEAGLAKATLNRILNGKQELQPNTLQKIANALGVSFYELDQTKDDMDTRFQVAGYIDFCGDIFRIKSLKDLKKQVADIEHLQSLFKVKQAKLPKQEKIRLSDIDFTRWETIDATNVEVKSFRSGEDIIDGEKFNVGNMCSGYPFLLCGEPFNNSEAAYIAGMFSRNTPEHIRVQRLLQQNDDGYAAKKQIRMRNQGIAIPENEWKRFNLEWMKFVVWEKCRTNKDFAELLKSVPETTMIVENCTGMTSSTAQYWGCSNKQLSELRDAKEKKFRMENPRAKKDEINIERNRWTNYGVWEGYNCMGKILKACSLCLIHGRNLSINTTVLNRAGIYLLGNLEIFTK